MCIGLYKSFTYIRNITIFIFIFFFFESHCLQNNNISNISVVREHKHLYEISRKVSWSFFNKAKQESGTPTNYFHNYVVLVSVSKVNNMFTIHTTQLPNLLLIRQNLKKIDVIKISIYSKHFVYQHFMLVIFYLYWCYNSFVTHY